MITARLKSIGLPIVVAVAALILWSNYGVDAVGSSAGLAILWIFFGAIALAIYLLPAFVARSRSHPNTEAITLLNILLGWTFLGWVIALIWAVTKSPRRSL